MKTDQPWPTQNGDVVTIDDWKLDGVSQGIMAGCYKFLVQMILPESILTGLDPLGAVYIDYFKDELFKVGYLPGKYDVETNDSEIVANSITIYSDCDDCIEKNKIIIPDIILPIGGV